MVIKSLSVHQYLGFLIWVLCLGGNSIRGQRRVKLYQLGKHNVTLNGSNETGLITGRNWIECGWFAPKPTTGQPESVFMSEAASIPVTRGLNTLPKKGHGGFLLALYSTQDTYVGILDISDLHHIHIPSHDMSLCVQFYGFLLKLFMVSFTGSQFAYPLSVYAPSSP